MKHPFFYLLFFALLVSPVFPQAQKNTSKNTESTAQKPKSFIDRVLEFLSISYTPGAQKGPAGDASRRPDLDRRSERQFFTCLVCQRRLPITRLYLKEPRYPRSARN